MRTSKKSVGLVFNVFLFAAILLIPATAFNANAQEEYKEEKNRDYERYYSEGNYYYFDNNDDYKNKYNLGKYDEHDDQKIKKSYDTKENYKFQKIEDLVTIKKELFICSDITEFELPLNDVRINCREDFGIPVSPNDENYVKCTDEFCPGIDESSFTAFIHKDVAFVQDLTSEGNSVKLDKFHYTVSEDELDDRNGFDNFNCGTEFDDSVGDFRTQIGDLQIDYNTICAIYEGDCQGIIYGNEEKTCTIKNYIVNANIFSTED